MFSLHVSTKDTFSLYCARFSFQWRLCWLSVYGILTYEFKCPDELNRKLRIQEICKERSPDEYSCLMDEQSNTYKESCMDSPDFVRPGTRYKTRYTTV